MAKSDGGDASYYQFPSGFTDLQDIIEFKKMSFGQGNIFKAAYRLGNKDDVTEEYDLNKIIWFAKRRLKELKASKPKIACIVVEPDVAAMILAEQNEKLTPGSIISVPRTHLHEYQLSTLPDYSTQQLWNSDERRDD